MAVEDLQLDGAATFTQAMERLPQGRAALTFAKRVGLYTPGYHGEQAARREFPKNIGALGPRDLSNELAYWTADMGRLCEMMGLLAGVQVYLRRRSKAVRASARARVRRQPLPEGKKSITVSELNDLAEEDDAVIDVEDSLAYTEILLAWFAAAKEATAQNLTTLSREITFRDSQYKARLA